MTKGMIFDLYREGEDTVRVMAVNKTDVVVLTNLTIIENIDFENEVESILIDNILKLK